MTDNGDPPVKATTTSARVVDAVIEADGATLTELTEHLDLSKGTIHNHVDTLEQLGFLVREEWTYHVSLEFLSVGRVARERHRIYRHGRSEMKSLATATELTTNLTVLERGRGICLASSLGVRIDEPFLEGGERFPLYCTAPGKAMLSTLDTAKARRLVRDAGQEPMTENTLTTWEALADELDQIRTQGLAVDQREWKPDVRGIAAPVTDRDGDLVGTISVMSSSESMSGKRFQQDIPGLVISSANKIYRNTQTG
jgi:DNA-binding IclR family transcriptional regulator